MEIFYRPSFIISLIVLSLVQRNVVAGTLGSKAAANLITTKPQAEPPIRASNCPSPSTISPCNCEEAFPYIRMYCDGSAVNETSMIENSFREVRLANEIPEDRGVHLKQFSIGSTDLTQFDLVPFYGSRINDFLITTNLDVAKWVTSGNPQDQRSIQVDTLYFSDVLTNGDELAEVFKYFSVEMTGFYASNIIINPTNNNNNNNNNADANEGDFEFLPGLSAFVNLGMLRMDKFDISGSLNSSSFNAFPKLVDLSLWTNRIDGIGENVFTSNLKTIGLMENNLDETSFHPNSGIAATGGGSGYGKALDLSLNQITTLPIEIFGTFLDAHPENELELYGNPLICDQRLSWIKARREELRFRVPDAYCDNDPGSTIFESDYIP